jgi:hypothetical protein
MKEPVATETPKPVTLDARQLIDWLFGMGKTGMNLLHALIAGPYASSVLDIWLRARWLNDDDREWAQADGGWAERSRPTLSQIIDQYSSTADVKIAPMLCSQMAAAIQCPWPVVWAAVKVRAFPPQYGEPGQRVDALDSQAVFERFMSMPIAPHLLIDEGDRMVGLWKLDVPYTDVEDGIPAEGMTAMQVIQRQQSTIAPRRGARLLHKLAHSLSGDIVSMAKSEEAAFCLPGLKRDAFYPSHVVTATCRDLDGRTTIEELERMATDLAANLR